MDVGPRATRIHKSYVYDSCVVVARVLPANDRKVFVAMISGWGTVKKRYRSLVKWFDSQYSQPGGKDGGER